MNRQFPSFFDRHEPEDAPPKELDAISDVVLAYKPKPVSKPAKKRKRRAKKISEAKGAGS